MRRRDAGNGEASFPRCGQRLVHQRLRAVQLVRAQPGIEARAEQRRIKRTGITAEIGINCRAKARPQGFIARGACQQFDQLHPALLPFGAATLRIMFGVAWKVALTAELFGGSNGLGYITITCTTRV